MSCIVCDLMRYVECVQIFRPFFTIIFAIYALIMYEVVCDIISTGQLSNRDDDVVSL